MRAAQVFVTVFIAGVNGGGVDGGFDDRFGWISRIILNGAGGLGEGAAHSRNTHVTDGKFGITVRRIDLPDLLGNSNKR